MLRLWWLSLSYEHCVLPTTLCFIILIDIRFISRRNLTCLRTGVSELGAVWHLALRRRRQSWRAAHERAETREERGKKIVMQIAPKFQSRRSFQFHDGLAIALLRHNWVSLLASVSNKIKHIMTPSQLLATDSPPTFLAFEDDLRLLARLSQMSWIVVQSWLYLRCTKKRVR